MNWKKNTLELTGETGKIRNKHEALCVRECVPECLFSTRSRLPRPWLKPAGCVPPPALKNTFHFNVAAAHKVICHSIMTKQNRRLSSVPVGSAELLRSGSAATAELASIRSALAHPLDGTLQETGSQALNTIFHGYGHLISRWLT